MSTLIGVDIGGTFTDVVVVDRGRVTTAKVSTTPDDPSRGMIEGIGEALDAAAIAPGAVASLAHGTTVATNALLERRGARTGLVATRGFADVLELARQARPHLYRPCRDRPRPLPELTAEVDERLSPDGVIRRLDPESVAAAARRLRRAGVESVAVCLLHSYADPRHEQRVADALRRELPDAFVVASHEIAAEYREYERASTVSVDAYLGPPAARYLHRLGEGLAERGLPEPLLMQSSGGLCSLDEAAAHPARLLLSGPAGGVAAVIAGGARDAVAFDMGGTSCDVSLIRGGVAGRSTERLVAGLPVRLPMLDIHTVGAGGGSIAWVDEGGALRVGPRSAGADPGPACYGRGGRLPTVTDANLVLGRLGAKEPLAGGLTLDRRAAERAIATVAGGFRSLRAAAEGIVAVADEEMVRAIRVVSVEQGHDPRDLELVAFGGAGPLHGCGVADSLGIRRIRVPAASGVLSALGIAECERRRDGVRGVVRPLASLTAAEARGLAPRLPRERGARAEASADLRYRGQGFELNVPLEPWRSLPERFHRRHRQRFGFDDRDGEIEVINLRATVSSSPPRLTLARAPRVAPVRGPARVPLDGATLWVAKGWTARRTADGTWEVTR
jgi:N-methylhydantoinase A/oxoprolinase/acetone carboxylase beta subunit